MVFLRAKVVVIGDCTVGKSAICQVLGTDGGNFPKNYTCTLMTDLVIKQIHLTDTNDTVELFLHDSSGKAAYFEHCKETWINADIICLVYDVSNKDSFGHCKFWFEKAKEVFLHNKKPIGCIIGNKTDLHSTVNQEAAKQLADSLKVKHFLCSAKDNRDIIEPFKYLATEFVKKYKEKVKQIENILE